VVHRFKTPADQVMTYAARGEPTKVIATRVGIPQTEVIRIIEAHA
jgi:hypothetical protein